MVERWKRVLRLKGSSRGPYVQVDEAAVVESWMDGGGGGKKMVKLLDGEVFEVIQTVDVPVPPEERGKIKFKSSDGVEFEVNWLAARKAHTNMLKVSSCRTDNRIPIVEVTSKILDKVLDYCYKFKHVPRVGPAAAANTDELKIWEADFVKVDLDTLYHLVKAARYLVIDGLEDLACRAVADIIEGKRPEEIRAMFNTNKDMTPVEEEVAVRELHACQRATLENMKLAREEDRRDWMDTVNSKFCTFYMLDFY